MDEKIIESINLNWQYIVNIVQGRIQAAEGSDGFKEYPFADWQRRKAFAQFAELFGPEFNTPKNRDNRINVLRAIFGRPLSSLNDLSGHELYFFSEVIDELGSHITRGISDKFTRIIEERFASTAWLFASDETVSRMWNMPSGDESTGDTAGTHARGDNYERDGAGVLTGNSEIGEPPF